MELLSQPVPQPVHVIGQVVVDARHLTQLDDERIIDAHVDVAEVVLRELAGEALEADHRPWPLGPQLLEQGVQDALAAGVALELGAAE
jgi:hypothetical protein